MERYGIIMAGGGGTRFWPLSRREIPKQLLNLTGKDTMVNETIDRIAKSVPDENIYIVTNKMQADLMKKVTKGKLQSEHILSEPAARNTAACIGYAAIEIRKKYGDGIMCVLASDHYIKDNTAYTEVMNFAMDLAEKEDRLVTIGIKPTSPATGYGYIKYNKKIKEVGHTIGRESGKRITAYPVADFVEKPSLSTAKSYVEQGCYLWNSGMFVWKTSVILKYFEELLPDVYECLLEIEKVIGTDKEKEVIDRVYPTIPKISVDYGIMERADNVIVLEGDFGWSDVGSWDALDTLYDVDGNNNVIYGEQIHIGSKNCIAYGKNRLIATIGLDNIIIVETDDAVLVCDKNKAQDVKKIVEILEEQGKNQYL
ncbi:MAG: mannose-1-phosphate guanylyltransferase [Clostridiales bacterium]|nr:mannose-1-phosphate guanylyltransferase [Clostridiales bacterium]